VIKAEQDLPRAGGRNDPNNVCTCEQMNKKIKGIIHQEEISIFNIYAPNTGAPIYIKINSNHAKSTDRH
jgi:hypothetical protein